MPLRNVTREVQADFVLLLCCPSVFLPPLSLPPPLLSFSAPLPFPLTLSFHARFLCYSPARFSAPIAIRVHFFHLFSFITGLKKRPQSPENLKRKLFRALLAAEPACWENSLSFSSFLSIFPSLTRPSRFLVFPPHLLFVFVLRYCFTVNDHFCRYDSSIGDSSFSVNCRIRMRTLSENNRRVA